MSMDDPGWGDYVAPSDDTEKTAQRRVPQPPQPQSPPQPPPQQPASPFAAATPPATRPSGRPSPRVIAAAVVVVLVAAGAGAYALTSGSPAKPKAHHTTVTHPKHGGGGGGGGGSTALTKAQYIAKADDICTKYGPAITADENADDVSALYSDGGDELAAIKALGDPTTGAATAEQILNDDEEALQTLAQNNVAGFQVDALAAEELAGSFGMHVCNGGN